jgi:hypothetical protein
MFCSKCGIGLDKNSEFCSKCGTAVVKKSTAVPTSKSKSILNSSKKAEKPKPKMSSRIGTVLTYVVTGLVVLVFGSAILSGGGSEGETPSGPGESTISESEETVQLGSSGMTESGINVRAISTDSSPEIPNDFVIDPGDIKGQLVSVNFSVTNGSNEEIFISDDSITGFIGDAEYRAEAIFSQNGDWYIFEPLGPGLSVEIDVFFDVPPGSELTRAVFSSSSFLGEEIDFSLR